MNLWEALGPGITSQRPQQRSALPRALFVGSDAAPQLAALMREESAGTRAAMVFDTRTGAAAGEACGGALREAGFDVHEVLLPDHDGHSPVCDDTTQAWLREAVPEVDTLVGVGSGVISDLCKWVAFELSKPAAIYATAASMNGYSAANVAPSIAGVKSLFSARAHRVIAAAPAVLAAAPRELTSAGLGDVIAKAVSTADWKMNELLFGEGFSPEVAAIIDDVEKRFLAEPERLAEGDGEAVGALLEALVLSGCAMTLIGSSMPASGGEHLISHALDMRAGAEGKEHDLHGRQVGVATIFAASLYARVLAQEELQLHAEPLALDRTGWGAIANSVAEHHEKQSARLAAACERLAEPGVWPQLRETLQPMVPEARWVKDVLERAGAAHRIEDLGIEKGRFLWAVNNGAQIRERFTSLDLAWATGVLPGAGPELCARYLR
ncbi:MAG: iron-containing alcohol dehydrogenase [Myxococcales bacterium]|nr:iron-containing alcohol dehydrogenase [Myxococcales bacterium]